MGFWDGLQRGLKGESSHGRYETGGKAVRCAHCEGDTFDAGHAQLNTAVSTLMNVDWINPTAHTLACEDCGLITWFTKAPERLDD